MDDILHWIKAIAAVNNRPDIVQGQRPRTMRWIIHFTQLLSGRVYIQCQSLTRNIAYENDWPRRKQKKNRDISQNGTAGTELTNE